MKKYIIASALMLAILPALRINAEETKIAKDLPEAKLGWKLSSQAWTFRNYTLFQTLDKLKKLGIRYIEIFPGQRICKQSGERNLPGRLSKDMIKKIKAKMKECGVTPVAFGVIGFPTDNEKECRKIFEHAKLFGIKTILSEPALKDSHLDLLEKLAEEYQINVAIHNHPKNSRYWHPDTVLKALKGRSNRLGAAADTGHWVRSGLDPVECLKKYQGRLLHLHFKDLKAKSPRTHDVPWGTGVSNAAAQLAELRRQNFKGCISMEYEKWDRKFSELEQNVKFFREQAKKLQKVQPEWEILFDGKNLDNFNCKPNGWFVNKKGEISFKWGCGFLWTKKQYGNFRLELEVKLDKKTNSGIFIRTASKRNWLHTGIEIQVRDSFGIKPHKHSAGAVYDLLAARVNAVRPAGKWNRYIVDCQDNKITVTLNDVKIIDMDVNKWTQDGKNPDGSKNKFKTAIKNWKRHGFIGFQDHKTNVWYRNIRIKDYDEVKKRKEAAKKASKCCGCGKK